MPPMTAPPPPPPDPDPIIAMASAFYDSCVLFTATDLGIFAHLHEAGTAGADALATIIGGSPRGTQLLLDACVALGLLEKEDGAYRNTPAADAYLVPGGPGDLVGALRYNRDVYSAWGRLPDLVRSGEPVEAPEIHLGEDEVRTRTFVMAMHHRALAIGRALVPMLSIPPSANVLDLAGGPGTYAVFMAKTHPGIHCTVLDLPPVVQIAKELIREQGMQDRVTTLPGSYHDTPYPGDQQVITILGALHQESPEAIAAILRKAAGALSPGGMIHIMDMMTDTTHTAPKFSALFAVNMALTTAHGWVFSSDEMTGWLEDAGFVDISIRALPPPMPHWLATASRP